MSWPKSLTETNVEYEVITKHDEDNFWYLLETFKEKQEAIGFASKEIDDSDRTYTYRIIKRSVQKVETVILSKRGAIK